MEIIGKKQIYVWSDDTWCFPHQIEDYGWMSDDFEVLHVPEELSDDDIDSVVVDHNRGKVLKLKRQVRDYYNKEVHDEETLRKVAKTVGYEPKEA